MAASPPPAVAASLPSAGSAPSPSQRPPAAAAAKNAKSPRAAAALLVLACLVTAGEAITGSPCHQPCAHNKCSVDGTCQCLSDTYGTCNIVNCSPVRGLTECRLDGYYKCFCKEGYCSVRGICRQSHWQCEKETMGSCRFVRCGFNRGVVTEAVACTNGRCTCTNGYCMFDGKCYTETEAEAKQKQEGVSKLAELSEKTAVPAATTTAVPGLGLATALPALLATSGLISLWACRGRGRGGAAAAARGDGGRGGVCAEGAGRSTPLLVAAGPQAGPPCRT